MTGGQWETVGSKNKKSKNKVSGSKSVRKENKQINEAFGVSAPIQESQTIYDAFLERSEAPPAVEKKQQQRNGGEPKSRPQQKKKGERKGEGRPPKVGLEEAITSVTEEDLRNQLATLGVLFPDAPLLWLKDLTTYFNVKFDFGVDDLAFSTKPTDYPSSLMNGRAARIVQGVFRQCSPQMLLIFCEFCLQNMMQDILRGLHTLGYRVMLQLLALHHPSAVLGSLPVCSKLCHSHPNRVGVCLSVMWAAGQVCNHSLELGIKAWTGLMLPLMGSKNCTAYAVEYLEKLLGGGGPPECSQSLLDVRDLLSVLDLAHSKETPKSVQRRLIALYPALKELSYGPEPQNVLKNYFPSYLRRLEPHCPQPLREELLRSLVFCLERDVHCYSVWRQLYTKHFVQSKLLIGHLCDAWGSMPPNLPLKTLRGTLAAFQVTNMELSAAARNPKDVQECILASKELLSKMSSTSLSWPRLLLILTLAGSLVLTLDILVHSSLSGSAVARLTKSSGFLLLCSQAADKLLLFWNRLYRLLQPVGGSVRPLLDASFQRAVAAAPTLWGATEPLRSWCDQSLPVLLRTVEEHFVLCGTHSWSLARHALTWLGQLLVVAVANFADCIDSTSQWLQSTPQIAQSLETTKSIISMLCGKIQESISYVWQQQKLSS